MVAPHLPNRPKRKAHVDITPILYTAWGERIELGMIRYEIELDDQAFELRANGFYSETPPTRLDNSGAVQMSFRLVTSTADKPQPQVIDAVSAYPKIEANAQYGKWTNAQGHPIDAEGRPIFPDGVR